MQATQHQIDMSNYASCVELSRRVRWEMERDVLRNFSHKLRSGACKCIALLFAAPIVALAYVIVLPVIGLGMLAWMGAKAWFVDV